MNIYRLLRLVNHIRSPRLRLLALWGAHITGRRYIGVFFDSVLGCNYRCQMCYFSNDETRHSKRGKMTAEQVESVAHSIFPRTLKLQIGCGAEPTLDINGAIRLVTLGKQYRVPYISLTTNGVLLTEQTLSQLAQAGLNELTISLHGIRRETYERLMGPTSKYDAFLALLQKIKHVKSHFPQLNIRINYTMNADNVDELSEFDALFADIPINQLQLRPVRKIGDSVYQNFDLTHVAECLDTVVKPLSERCAAKGITVLLPEQIHIDRFEHKTQSSAREQLLSLFTYHYISPPDYDQSPLHYATETYNQYSRRNHIGRLIWRGVWASEKTCSQIGSGLQNALNYDIR